MTQSRLFRGCVGEASLRVESSTRSRRWQWMPRVLLHYAPASHWRLSLSAGRYAQEPPDTVMARGAGAMRPAIAVHMTAGLQGNFGRTHVYGYRQGRPITNTSDRFFYFGIFVSLQNHQAYEISNF